MPAHDPKDRSRIARIAALTSLSQTDNRSARTQATREAFDKRFEDQVDPFGKLAPAERATRAEAARKAYFVALARKSVEKWSRK